VAVLRCEMRRIVNKARRRRQPSNLIVINDWAVEGEPLHVTQVTQYDHIYVMRGFIALKSKYL
jgi:hypothetical protein